MNSRMLFLSALLSLNFFESRLVGENLLDSVSSLTTQEVTLPEIDLTQFQSQARQDLFVYTLLYKFAGKKDPGTYLEIGSWYPKEINNSYFFEKQLNWEGVSLDILEIKDLWDSVRKNPLIVGDATVADYVSILKPFPKVIDYLSLDIDGYYDVVLNRLPHDEYIFKVVTIEHDFYRFGETFRAKEREILTSLGYYMLCPDVHYAGVGSFEDWWIHPSAFTEKQFNLLKSLDLQSKHSHEIIHIIESAIEKQQ